MKRIHASKEIDVAPEERLATIGTGAVCAKFTARWCGPCRRIHPQYMDYANAVNTKIEFLAIDVDASREFAAKFEIVSLPTFVFLRDGVEYSRLEGSDASKLQAAILAFDEANATVPEVCAAELAVVEVEEEVVPVEAKG